MKKALLFLPFSLLFPALLFGSVWNSNALGQKISTKERIEGVGWERVDEGDVSTLYYEGKVEKTRMTLKDGYEEKSESESLRIFINEEGHIVRKILESEKGSEEYNYFYSSSLLSGYTYSLDGAVVETCEYLRTPDGVVLGLIKDKNPIFFSGDRVYEMVDGSLETFFIDEEEKERDIEWKEDGGYIEVKRENGGSVEYTYDGNGRLVSKESPDSLISYFYSSEGSLIKTREERKNEILETEYRDGKVYSTSIYDPSFLLKSVRVTLSDGTYEETRYIDGVKRYVFHLDNDGERILEARGL